MLFGSAAPKFIYDYGGEDEAHILLDFVKILRDEPDKRMLEAESEISGHREFELLGKHWIFQVQVHLFKYYTKLGQDPLAKYEEIKQYEGLDVILYPHRDKDPMRNSSGENVLFTITAIDETYFDTPTFHDLLIITFESKDFVDKTQNLTGTLTDDTDAPLQDDTGSGSEILS